MTGKCCLHDHIGGATDIAWPRLVWQANSYLARGVLRCAAGAV